MVQTFKIPWRAWYGDEDFILEFPDSWDIQLFNMKDAKAISNKTEIEKCLKNPIDSSTIYEISKGKQSAVIVFDDISRPNRMDSIISVVLEELTQAGISKDKITLISAIGAHRPMTRQDFIKKVGLSVVESMNIENHHPYENLIYIGESAFGTPIYVNKTYYEADVKISIGSVIPTHSLGLAAEPKLSFPESAAYKL